jgi:hypothetical protein
MEDINKHCADNLGGIFLLRYIPKDDVESIVEPINGRVTEPVVLKANKRWFEFYATPETLKFNEEQQESPQGDYFKIKLTGATPKDRADIISAFNKMKKPSFIIDYTDNNGLRKLVGTITEPLRFKHSSTTGDKAPSKNGHSFEFFGDVIDKSPEYYI